MLWLGGYDLCWVCVMNSQNISSNIESLYTFFHVQVNKGRVQLYPLFEDYDRVHNGTVSRSQFRRVLSELELAPLVNEVELDVLWKKFEITIGGKFDVDYCSFCDLIYKKAKIELFRP